MLDWSGLNEYGFAPFSRAFLANYRMLNITLEEAMLVMHLLDYVWLGEKEFPTTAYFAQKTGKSEQTIRMYLKSLRYKGYLLASQDGKHNVYDYSPLIAALRDVANVPSNRVGQSEEVVEKSDKSELGRLVDVNNQLALDKSITRVPVNTKPQHWKRLQSFLDKSADKYNVKDLEFLLASEWDKKDWKSPAPRFFGRDLKQGKELIKIYGADVVAKVISHFVQNWEQLAPQFNIKGYPSMPIFWGFRNAFFPFVIDGQLNNQPTWGTHYKEEQTQPGGEIGWG